MLSFRKRCAQCVVVFGMFGLFAWPADAALYEGMTQLEAGTSYASNSMFSSVGWVSAFDSSTRYFSGCGVLINSEWVLTVGHVATTATGSYNYGFSLNSSTHGTTSNEVIMADAVFTYPGYVADSWGGTVDDIALMHLSSAITGVTAATLYTGSNADLVGTQVYTSGYGIPGTASDGFGGFDGIKRAGENIVSELGSSTYAAGEQYLITEFNVGSGEPLEWQATAGDSGGGWFIAKDGNTYLVGLGDFAYDDFISGAISVSPYAASINETIASLSVPEPSSLLLLVTLGIAGVPVARRCRRKQ